MKITPTTLPDCYEIIPNIRSDERGCFIKTFNRDLFLENQLEACFLEEYYTESNQRVLRGLHFQTPPKEHAKLVYVVAGEVTDAVVDMRKGSPTYGKFETFVLSAEKRNMVYIPAGVAHGFYVLSQKATLVYNVTSVYSPEHDSGILWNSAGIPWPDSTPILSKRDAGFLPFGHYATPFRWNQNE